jgi:hypothetical protein
MGGLADRECMPYPPFSLATSPAKRPPSVPIEVTHENSERPFGNPAALAEPKFFDARASAKSNENAVDPVSSAPRYAVL